MCRFAKIPLEYTNDSQKLANTNVLLRKFSNTANTLRGSRNNVLRKITTQNDAVMSQALRHLKSNLNKPLFAQMFSYRNDISACNFLSESKKKNTLFAFSFPWEWNNILHWQQRISIGIWSIRVIQSEVIILDLKILFEHESNIHFYYAAEYATQIELQNKTKYEIKRTNVLFFRVIW